jgi:hypothetical protein
VASVVRLQLSRERAEATSSESDGWRSSCTAAFSAATRQLGAVTELESVEPVNERT